MDVTIGAIMAQLQSAAATPTTGVRNREVMKLAHTCIKQLGLLVDELEAKVEASKPVIEAPARLGCPTCGGTHSDGSICSVAKELNQAGSTIALDDEVGYGHAV